MASARSEFRCLIGSETVRRWSFDPHQTLLDFLRLEARLTGTKEGCAEGDCGACTVLLGRLRNGALRYDPVNACIVPLGSVDSMQVLTVEHLADAEAHPVQQAMAREHGSQCGFCTPGIVMSLAGLHDACARGQAVANHETINDVLAGNLCRCTGYGPIIAAAKSACTQPAPAAFDSLRTSAEKTLREWQGDTGFLDMQGSKGRFAAPIGLDSLWQIQRQLPDAQLIAGSTDVGLWVNKHHKRFQGIIDLGKVQALRGIQKDARGLTLGAGVTLAECIAPLSALASDLGPLLHRFGSRQVRAQATVGGNIANASPIGDLAPALIALGASVELASADGKRSVALESFFIDYRKRDIAPGEIVASVSVPLDAHTDFHCWKVSKRFDQDISAVCGAFGLAIDNGTITSARVAFGGMAATPRRAALCEQALTGQLAHPDLLESAGAALEEDFAPISDMRASASYRMLAARGLLERCLRRISGETVPELFPLAHSLQAPASG
ncbi:MAG: xanthine dehydrogenase small subunit [Acidiferrobacteraceae bacterium]|jgi:xanthine dehydrogenase small subunit|nr:xanthine dehydrogenase small subunit [Acidiferrobacteraceae bacterium]MDP6552558.1 xanthine dehydrogenase small subunit [Arenicellales bacterium]MDP6791256.1 xanthine dehydrogenase small subunit [Arenicellales bacterium]MDP6918319.1 xanthine dehydrogenase small subunit [Arenicellales bacterium]|tara:strand:- start:8508 stop:9998 length:1491 start_codon:yes stop_codon:yes gene_type:complete